MPKAANSETARTLYVFEGASQVGPHRIAASSAASLRADESVRMTGGVEGAEAHAATKASVMMLGGLVMPAAAGAGNPAAGGPTDGRPGDGDDRDLRVGSARDGREDRPLLRQRPRTAVPDRTDSSGRAVANCTLTATNAAADTSTATVQELGVVGFQLFDFHLVGVTATDPLLDERLTSGATDPTAIVSTPFGGAANETTVPFTNTVETVIS